MYVPPLVCGIVAAVLLVVRLPSESAVKLARTIGPSGVLSATFQSSIEIAR